MEKSPAETREGQVNNSRLVANGMALSQQTAVQKASIVMGPGGPAGGRGTHLLIFCSSPSCCCYSLSTLLIMKAASV